MKNNRTQKWLLAPALVLFINALNLPMNATPSPQNLSSEDRGEQTGGANPRIDLKTYWVDGYQVKEQIESLSRIFPPEVLICLENPCDRPKTDVPSNLIVPVSIGETPEELFSKREQYLSQDFYPQKLAIVTGVGKTFDSAKVVGISREGQTWFVTIDSISDGSYFQPFLYGSVFQIDLGYLEPNHYQVIITWNSEGEPKASPNPYISAIHFTVSQPPRSPEEHLQGFSRL